MSWRARLFGRPLRSEEQEAEKIGPARGVPVLGLDALASAAYGPEAALTILLPLGAAATAYILPLSAVIIALLTVVALSYRQTIAAYPGGGGAYTVASQNLGARRALLAASALALDYVLNVAVAISAGVGAIVSALPALLPYTLPLCLTILALLTVVNLRGVREAGLIFMFPTYLFVVCLGATVVLGIAKMLLAHGHPTPVGGGGAPPRAVASVSAWLLLRAFASGCTAMTGVEAVSNGVPLFREPVVKNARRTLGAIVATLALLLAGIALLAHSYGIGATPPGAPGYESVLSRLIAAVAGRGVFYYVAVAAVVTVLCLSANTSFADFPRLCHALALDEYLPPAFAHPGARLVFSTGIVVLALLAGALLVAFGGITDRLIPLFAVGAFLAFTMSQWGMVAHWKRQGGAYAIHGRLLNGTGALLTGATVVVVAVSKFAQGAWLTVLVVPTLVLLFLWIRRSYERADRQLDVAGPVELEGERAPIVIIPLKRLDRVARKALRFALGVSADVEVVQVLAEDLGMEDLRARWCEWVERPAREAGLAAPRLVVLRSEYREFFGPLLRHVRQVAHANPRRYIAVVVPEVFERRWYELLLHSHRPTLLTGLLLLRGGPQVIVVNAPWRLVDRGEPPRPGRAREEPRAPRTSA